MQSLGLLAIRAMVGWVMVFHGAQKVFGAFGGGGMEGFIGAVKGMNIPQPEIAAYAAAYSELIGGAFLILGLLTRVAAVFVAATMFVAAFQAHAGKFSLQAGGMEYALTLAVIATGLVFTGAGVISADGLFVRSKPKDEPAPAKPS